MNPLDRIAQLTEENRQLLRSIDELRAQVETARQELARDSATIAKLAKDKQELVSALPDVEFLLRKIAINWREAGSMTDSCSRASKEITALLSRHA